MKTDVLPQHTPALVHRVNLLLTVPSSVLWACGLLKPVLLSVLLYTCGVRQSTLVLFTDELEEALAQVVQVKDLDVQDLDGPLDLSVHAVALVQGVTQVLL